MDNFSQNIRKFNRFELKYLVPLKQAEALKQTLLRYMVPDTYGNRLGRYTIASLYYDSPDFRCYHEKENGIKIRRKLRVRYYETGELLNDETTVFVEIKQRVDRVTQKRRIALTYQDALRLCNDRQMIDFDNSGGQELIDEIFVFLWQYHLLPANIVRYDRQAFIGTIYDAGLRVTFDTNLTYQAHPLHLHEHASSLPFFPPAISIMEIKVNERIPYWLTEMIAAHNLQMIRISKYCRSIEAAHNVHALHCRSPLAESSEEVLATTFSLPLFWERLCQPQQTIELKQLKKK